MNVVMTQSGKILEIQGTAEKAAFTKDQVVQIIDAATESDYLVFLILQHQAADGEIVRHPYIQRWDLSFSFGTNQGFMSFKMKL